MDKPIANRGAEKTRHKADSHALAVLPAIDVALEAGPAGLAEIADWLNRNGVPTARGGVWRPETVRRTLHRLADLGHASLAPRSRRAGQSARSLPQYVRQAKFADLMNRRRAEREAAGKL